MISAVVAGLAILALVGFFIAVKKSGKDAAENEVMKETLDDVYLAKKARDALAARPDAAKRVRRKYTRK